MKRGELRGGLLEHGGVGDRAISSERNGAISKAPNASRSRNTQDATSEIDGLLQSVAVVLLHVGGLSVHRNWVARPRRSFRRHRSLNLSVAFPLVPDSY
jgi:hypothetical protein